MFFNFVLSQAKVGRKAKSRALPGFAFDPDLSAHHIHQASADGQSQPDGDHR